MSPVDVERLVPDRRGAGEPAHPDRRGPRRRHRVEQRQHGAGDRPRPALLRRALRAHQRPGPRRPALLRRLAAATPTSSSPTTRRRPSTRRWSPRRERGVDVRGLLWRSHWHRLGFSAHRHRYLGEDIGEAGGQCLRDMRVRTRGAHHQKFVVIRHADDPTRDIAYVGGIDLCHGRRDDHDHHGDPQVDRARQGLRPDPAVARRPGGDPGSGGPRRRDDLPRAVGGQHPAHRSTPAGCSRAWCTARTSTPEPLGDQAPPPAAATDGHDVVQIVRTFPVILPKGFDFAPEGERSVMLSNTKAIAQAERLVYVEDQYLWSREVGEHFASALRDNPELRLVVVLPMVPDREGALAEVPQLYGRSLGDARPSSRRAATGSRCSVCATRRGCRSTSTPRPA